MSDAQSLVDFSYEPEPPDRSRLQPRRSLLRFLTEHNPFYLLSAACMLASCLALTNSLSWISITRSRLLTLIVTLNVYEAALLAIALFLITRRKLRRDGRMLLLLQAFFLADFSVPQRRDRHGRPADRPGRQRRPARAGGGQDRRRAARAETVVHGRCSSRLC